jgi:hypothetical protein
VSVGAVCAGKVTRKCLEKWKKGEKNSRFVALLRPWKEEVKTREKSGLVFLRLKTKAFLLFCFGLDVIYRKE